MMGALPPGGGVGWAALGVVAEVAAHRGGDLEEGLPRRRARAAGEVDDSAGA